MKGRVISRVTVLGLVALLLCTFFPVLPEAALTTEADCINYEGKRTGDQSGEKVRLQIDNEKKTMTVEVRTRQSNQVYGLYFYQGYHWAIRELGEFEGEHSFQTRVAIDKLYQEGASYLFRMNFGQKKSQIEGDPFNFGGVFLTCHQGKLYFERYLPVEEKNQTVMESGSRVLTENYLDVYMTDSYETDYGAGLNQAKVKVIRNFAKSLIQKEKAETSYEQALAFHDFIGQHYVYDWSGHGELNPYELYQDYVKGRTCKTICNGYAAYFVMLCRSVGIPARTVKGKSISLEKEHWSSYPSTKVKYDHVWSEAYVDTDGDGREEWTTFDCDGDSITRGYQYTLANPSLQALSVTRMYLNYREVDATYIKPAITDIQSVTGGVRLKWNAGLVCRKGSSLTWAQKENVKAYVIYRGTSSGTLKKIATIASSKLNASYLDKKAKRGVTYYYKVAAVAKSDGQEGRPGLYRTIIRR